jgi:hypothetical protein
MHLTLKKEATRPAGANSLQQQAKFDEFLKEFNEERPHEALFMKTPAQVYSPPQDPIAGFLRSSILCMIETQSLPPAAASACIARRSISQL